MERNGPGERVTVPSHLLHPRGGDHYVLQQESGQPKARLESAKKGCPSITLPASLVRIQGIVVGIMRKC